MTEFLKSLAKLKAGLATVPKDKENPYFHSNYADINGFLATVEPCAEQCGFVLTQPLEMIEDKIRVHTTLSHVGTGESLTSYLDFAPLDDPQKVGSAITYYRRYTLQSLLAMRADDDDGNKAKPKQKPKPKEKPTKTPELPGMITDPQCRKLEVMARADDLFDRSATVLYLFICKMAGYEVDEKASFADLKTLVKERFSKKHASELIERITENTFSDTAIETLTLCKAICFENTQP